MLFSYIPCKNAEEAKKLARSLLERRMAACVNILPAETLYRENGKTVETQEAVMFVKTFEEKLGELEEFIRANHSYKVPCIASFALHRVNREYKEWMMSCLR